MFAVTGDLIADLHEDLATEQKARVTYDNILRLVDDPDIREPIKFLREREIVHYRRFGEGLRLATDKLNSKNFYAFNPSFDKTKLKHSVNRYTEYHEKAGILKKVGKHIKTVTHKM